MNKLLEVVVQSRIESAENRVRSEHNDLETRKGFGKKNIFPYHSEKFIKMLQMIRG